MVKYLTDNNYHGQDFVVKIIMVNIIIMHLNWVLKLDIKEAFLQVITFINWDFIIIDSIILNFIDFVNVLHQFKDLDLLVHDIYLRVFKLGLPYSFS